MKPRYLSDSGSRRNELVPAPDEEAEEPFTLPPTTHGYLPGWRTSATTASTYFGRKLTLSTAFSKRTSAATFYPKFNKTRSKNETTLDYINADSQKHHLDIIRMDSFQLQNGQKEAVNKRSRTAFWCYLVGFLIIGALAGFSAEYYFQFELKAEQTDEADFCPGGDQAARDLIAAEFDNSINGVSLGYIGKIIECIPDDAFSALSESQKSVLSTVTSISFIANSLEKIGDKALIAPELAQVGKINIIDNGVSHLGNAFLESLPNLSTVVLSGNAFLRLDSDVFRKSSTTTLLMDSNPLLEVPTAIIDSQIKTISMTNCAGLVRFKPQMFENTTTISSIDLTLTGLSSLSTLPDVSSGLGVNADVLVGFS